AAGIARSVCEETSSSALVRQRARDLRVIVRRAFPSAGARAHHRLMTHRDELLSLQARVEAQQRELDDAKSEIALLRAAHAQKTREAEMLRRELDELGADVRPSIAPERARRRAARERDLSD